MIGHESTSSAFRIRALFPKPLDLSRIVDLVELKNRELDLLLLVLDLFGLGVSLLLSLLGTSTEPQHEMESGLLLDVVIGQGSTVLQLLTGKDETLLVRRNALLILNLCLDIVDGIRALDFESNGLPRQRFHEDLHIGDGSVADATGERWSNLGHNKPRELDFDLLYAVELGLSVFG